jgi:hypothetical protein
MRTHGAKELRDTIVATPRQNMSKIVQVRLLWSPCSLPIASEALSYFH